ncbi:hypothetical protein MGG_17486 [Pyricularia oryzae 70-15]|uniref:Rhamnogalacturonase A/B/Epimerase-like pectate lyase domain-containing protein n=1 Tax=Pyricularia oryzae (strain 70-15 / ATCC MYA-4617 / FGSC 8958) TaxID=242507 RepID=G4NDB7_PYRO7|nr:uncharacterized protein MGG_17486 [Pyricularia oryzae 70-15]EHA49255.1 hypothetical protein MGG_17486 [Pyricularia oryzae 70-15]
MVNMGLKSVFTSLILASGLLSSPALAAPSPQAPAPTPAAPAAAGGWWLGNLQRRGAAAYGEPGYQVFRNVRDFGAKGDGVSDDTVAINTAISQGGRCGQGCNSSTTTPGLVYFPPGTYVVSKPIVAYYYTQMIGDALNPPTLKAAANFEGMAVIDTDPYDETGLNWWVNQNNFFRSTRNFVIDLTGMPADRGAGIHLQVAQTAGMQNVHFKMRTEENTKQIGIFMDNGSGLFMSDLVFEGGEYGAFFGNQQFTTRNMTFRNCKTAIMMNWNWAWTFQDVTIENCGTGIDMSNGDTSQTVGSVLLLDSTIKNTPIGVKTAYNPASPETNGTLILQNVDMTQNVPMAVAEGKSKAQILAGNQVVKSFVQGRSYSDSLSAGKAGQAAQAAVDLPDVLLNKATGKVFTRSKPQYETVPAANFVSVKAAGAKGDGKSDDTAAIQAIFDKATPEQVIFFDHGAYVVSDTIKVPKNIRMTGEIWPYIMATGPKFQDQANPRAVFQVGQPGDVGAVEMSDMMFQTLGSAPGAIMIQWNLKQASQGAAGMWDVHVRIGGSKGTKLEYDNCKKQPNNPGATKATIDNCMGAFMLMHVTEQASVYMENNWFWVADHNLEPFAKTDPDPSQQINIFNGRGVLIESQQGPVWMWGTSSEHNVLYNYQTVNASNVYMALIQTETPYFQGNPEANTPFNVNANFKDPDFAQSCAGKGPGCARAWGLRAVDSKDVFVYGAGLYSFFENYGQSCLATASCQQNMLSLEQSPNVRLFGVSTKASTNMLTVNGKSMALDKDNRNNFCATLAQFSSNLS